MGKVFFSIFLLAIFVQNSKAGTVPECSESLPAKEASWAPSPLSSSKTTASEKDKPAPAINPTWRLVSPNQIRFYDITYSFDARTITYIIAVGRSYPTAVGTQGFESSVTVAVRADDGCVRFWVAALKTGTENVWEVTPYLNSLRNLSYNAGILG